MYDKVDLMLLRRSTRVYYQNPFPLFPLQTRVQSFCTLKKPLGYWESKDNQRKFLDSIANQEKLFSAEDWMKVNANQLIRQSGGSSLLKRYDNTWNLLTILYPEHSWPSIPPKIPRNYWNSLDNQRKFWLHVKSSLHLQSIEDLNSVSVHDIHKLGGSGLLSKYKSLYHALDSVFPEYDWSLQKLKKKPNYYWDSIENQRDFLNSLMETLDIKNLDELIHVTTNTIRSHGGRGLLSKYSSFYIALENIYPEHNWNESILNTYPRNYWKDINNQKKYMMELGKELGIKQIEEWRNIQISNHPQLKYFVGSYYNSYFDALETLFPDHKWEVAALGSRVPKNYWKSNENQFDFMEKIRKKYNFTVEEWVEQPVQLINENGGAGILSCHKNFIELLRSVYPNVEWNENERKQYPRGYWSDVKHIQKFLIELQTKLKLSKKEDWTRVSIFQIHQAGGGGLLRKYGTLYNILCIAFPEKEWNEEDFGKRDKRSEQRWLLIQLQNLLPNEELVEDFVHEELTRISGSKVEIDIFLPKYNIGFEYHGEHHYQDIAAFGPLELYKQRDKEKEELCKKYHVELNIIPYWWNGSAENLISYFTSHKLKDLLKNK